MNCAERLVEIFGTQADVARAFQLDRAVVNNWVKTGYVPARWAMEVEQLTGGRILAVDVLNDAAARKPVRVKSRPDDFAGAVLGSEAMNKFAPAKRIQSFHPPQRTLMGPGPTEIHPRVLTTMSQPAIGYLDPIFVEMMEELKSLLRYAYQTKNPLTFPVSGPGSVGMEYCFVNMVAPGDKVIVCRNGVFGGRMIENVERAGGVAVIVEDNWGEPVTPQKLEDALKKNRDAKVVAFVHAETSTGVQSDAKTLVEIAHKYDALTIVDAVTSLGGTPVLVDEWGIDAIYSASQKCLSCTPVEVSAWTKATTLASRFFLSASSSFCGVTGSPQLSSTITATPPARSTFSIMRPPNTPLRQTTTLSPGATILTKQYSMPTEPGPDTGNVSGFFVWYA